MIEPRYHTRFRRWMAARGMRWQTERYPRPPIGQTVAYRLSPHGPATARVVSVHGTGAEALYPFIGLFKTFLLRGYEVYAGDLDGHGTPGTSRLHPAYIDSAVPEMLRRADRGEGLPLHALGESLGGSLLLHALSDPGCVPVASAAVISAPLRLRVNAGVVANELPGLLNREVLAQRHHYGVWGMVPAFGPLKRGSFPIRLSSGDERRSLGYLSVVTDVIEDLRLAARAPLVETPTLLVYGERDLATPIDQGARLHRLLPNTEALWVSGGTHCSTPFDPDAEAALLRWFDTHAR